MFSAVTADFGKLRRELDGLGQEQRDMTIRVANNVLGIMHLSALKIGGSLKNKIVRGDFTAEELISKGVRLWGPDSVKNSQAFRRKRRRVALPQGKGRAFVRAVIVSGGTALAANELHLLMHGIPIWQQVAILASLNHVIKEAFAKEMPRFKELSRRYSAA